MPNDEHVLLLKQGISAWNAWREQNPDVRPDLSDADLRGLDVAHYNEDYYSDMDDLKHDMEREEGESLNVRYLTGEEIVFEYSDLRYGFDLRNANLSNAMLDGAGLNGADLSGATLENATFDGTDLVMANFRDANLVSASLSGAKLRSADFTSANLTESVLYDADLSGAQFDKSVMTRASVGATVFADNDLSTVIGLDSVRHSGPSTIGVDTLYKSKGKIPDTFLKRSGVPETLITFINAQPLQVFNFYTCFISYAEADDAFSVQLVDDLRSFGVRCWRWKEDAPLGKPLFKSIDDAIQKYDKLIVICSKSSLNSPAVIREVKRALQKEDKLGRKGKQADVLFPIRLDNFVFEWDHHLKEDITDKPIGDFRSWSEPDHYRKSLEKLIRDLRSTSVTGSDKRS
jgi:TIR domain/Pentapeptide repeats (8 copies)